MVCPHVHISMNSSCKLVLGFHVQCALLIKCLLGDKQLVVAKMDREYQTTCQEPCTSAAKKDIDWDKSVIHQHITTETLKCPGASKRSMDGAGYRTLADNSLAFKEINCLPSNMFLWLKEDEFSEDTLQSHKAKWYDSCTLQYNKTEVK